MLRSRDLAAPYAMVEIEMDGPIPDFTLPSDHGGAHVLVRWRGRPAGRFWRMRSRHGHAFTGESLRDGAVANCRYSIAAAMISETLSPAQQAPLSLTVAICTRGRPALATRCLEALVSVLARRSAAGEAVDILVVDNAPADDLTRAAAEAAGVRYVVEPLPGLDFGRNRALTEARGEWIAYIDDDAVIDDRWFDRLAECVAISPEAGAFTGPILPLMLETEAQLRFERAGGFGKDFLWRRYDRRLWGDAVYPLGAGRFGTGACMTFRVAAMRAIGGFDEALDTGPPLPGGGDIDAFFRVVRAGWPLVYVPGLLVFHEHRRDMPGLVRQYRSWGLGVMAFVDKSRRADPELRGAAQALMRWYARHHLARLAKAVLGAGAVTPRSVLAEIEGAIVGWFGEYERSRARVRAIRNAASDPPPTQVAEIGGAR